ncbi:hypothetical protein [Alkalibacillus silvisoli]|uniref:hypothetical protein n=1 Tax=Alkalibacillus silvisoli TaxID=392823 RepID=UPI0031DD7C46
MLDEQLPERNLSALGIFYRRSGFIYQRSSSFIGARGSFISAQAYLTALRLIYQRSSSFIGVRAHLSALSFLM